MLVVVNAADYPHPAKQAVKSYDEAFNSHIFLIYPPFFYLLREG